MAVFIFDFNYFTMKFISSYVNESIKDAQTVIPGFQEAYKRLTQQYSEQTHPKLRILDNLIILCLSTFVAQVVYMVLVGTKEPFNAFLAGCFCSLG